VRILILNWRDIQSPRAGGAELLTHEIARRLARRHNVTWFTSRAPGQRAEEDIDGIRVVRRGSELSTRFFAPSYARRRRWDVVVEEINTLPYLAPIWSRAPTVLFMPQLAREVWWYEAPKLVAPAGWAAEPIYLQPYRGVAAITISRSTCRDLRRLGARGPIVVLPMAVSTPAADTLTPRRTRGGLVAMGRLVPSKRFDHAIRALAHVRGAHPDAHLTIIGDGREREHLERLADRLGLRDAVRFTGRIAEAEKTHLLEESDVLVACAVREGWGLTVTEAARLGTPAVAYNVPGLRDSVIHGRTGLLTAQDPVELADSLKRLLADHRRYDAFRKAAWECWRELSWDRTAAGFERALLSAIGPAAGGRARLDPVHGEASLDEERV
jgi:glycosyltransferase involved in cell wall biosynthesis